MSRSSARCRPAARRRLCGSSASPPNCDPPARGSARLLFRCLSCRRCCNCCRRRLPTDPKRTCQADASTRNCRRSRRRQCIAERRPGSVRSRCQTDTSPTRLNTCSRCTSSKRPHCHRRRRPIRRYRSPRRRRCRLRHCHRYYFRSYRRSRPILRSQRLHQSHHRRRRRYCCRQHSFRIGQLRKRLRKVAWCVLQIIPSFQPRSNDYCGYRMLR